MRGGRRRIYPETSSSLSNRPSRALIRSFWECGSDFRRPWHIEPSVCFAPPPVTFMGVFLEEIRNIGGPLHWQWQLKEDLIFLCFRWLPIPDPVRSKFPSDPFDLCFGRVGRVGPFYDNRAVAIIRYFSSKQASLFSHGSGRPSRRPCRGPPFCPACG